MKASPTLHPGVNKMLGRLHADVRGILGRQFIGMYLYGSLAAGGFDKDSDIDVLVVTKEQITEEVFPALSAMHEKISAIDSPWAFQLEVSYIPRMSLYRYDPANNEHPHLDRDRGEKLHIMQHDSDWIIQRYILREHGITISGPDPGSLIAPVSAEDLKRAVIDIMRGWIKGFLDDSKILEKRGYQSYTVLTLCRILHTLEHGTIVSKPVAAEWAKKSLEPQWHPLIRRAWMGRQNPELKTNPEDLNGTLGFIRYTLGRIP